MKHSEFFSALKTGSIERCYLFEGEEEFTKRSAMKALREKTAGGDFAAMNEVYAEFFSEPYPARAAFEAAALPKGAKCVFASDIKRWSMAPTA